MSFQARAASPSSASLAKNSLENVKMTALKGVEQSLVKRILDEILEDSPSVQWSEIAGQEVLLDCRFVDPFHEVLFTGVFYR